MTLEILHYTFDCLYTAYRKFFKKRVFKGTIKKCTQTQWGLTSTFLVRCFHFYVDNFPGFNLDFIKYNNAGIIFQFNI